MRLFYGAYGFPTNACDVTRSLEVIENYTGVPIENIWTFQVMVTIVPPMGLTNVQIQEYLANEERIIRTAVSTPGFDLIFFNDNGVPTDLVLTNSGALDARGVHLVNFSSPQGTNDEYAGKRTVSFAMRARYAASGAFGSLVSFTETYQTIGSGGPRIINRETLNGGGVRQITRQQTICRASQSGQAVGYMGYPNLGGPGGAPRPLLPIDDMLPDQPQVTKGTPIKPGRVATHFPISWSYTAERVGTPFLLNI